MNPSTYIPIIIVWIIIFIMFRNQKAVVAKKIIKNRKMEDKAEMMELAKNLLIKSALFMRLIATTSFKASLKKSAMVLF